MNEGQMKDLMKLVWGTDPTDNNNPRNVGNLLENTLNNNTTAITTALQNNLNALNALTTANQNRTTSKVVDVPFFYGRDDEDPYEWCRLFEAAFAANGWPDNRKIALAAGFLKEAARDWYEEDRGNINQWHVDDNANNFDTRLINYFATAARRNQWTRELQNIKQGDNESVENYSRHFKKLLNKATQGEALAARYQINYYINGLKSFLVGQVVIGNTNTLEATITRAKLVELGVNTTLLTTTPVTTSTTEPIPTTTTVKPTPQVDEMEALTKQMQQLALNYANLSSVLMVQQSTPRNTRPRPNNNNNQNRQNDDEAEIYYDEYENEYEEEWEEEDEYEAYVTTRSRSVPYEISSPRGKRTRFSESQKEDQLRTQPIPPVTPSTPMEMDATAEPSTKRKVRTKMVPAPIENVNEFDIAKYISDLPCGLSIGQATAQLPVYRKGLIQSMRRKREKIDNNNYIGESYYGDSNSEEETPTTAAKCEFHINQQPVIAVIDSGAAVSIMTTAMMKTLKLTIDGPSEYVIKTANGTRVRSLGKIQNLPLKVRNLIIKTNVQIIESSDSVFILGNNWMRKQSFEYDDEEEYESEELEEAQIYISDFSGYSTEESLEFNPWENEVSPAHQNNEDEELEESNPAIYLAQAEVYSGEKVNPDLHLGPLDYHQQSQFQQLLSDYADICAKSQTEIGKTNVIKHKIITKDATPIFQPPYRCNPKYREFLQGEITRMESQGLIRKSASPWASPVVIVDKKGGEKRLCIDYRKLNAVTKADAYPLPRIDDMLESFSNATWFTTLDLASGYWQVAMDSADVEKTAFITPFGLYEFLEYLGKFVAVYLDDVIIYSKGTLEQHLDHLRQVFETLRRANLKIKLKKCYFCLGNIHFLGHVVGREGIRPDPEKIEKIKTFPVPTNLTQLRSALGLFSYYRKFIKDFSKIAKPMLLLLKKETPFHWTEKQQTAFDYLKERLAKSPILTYPDFEQPFIIHTDASGTGLGAVLLQIREDGKEHVVAYTSRSLNKAECNYPITDQECLAIVWAIKHFQHYLGLKPFTIVTDHSALKWLKTSKIPKGRRARWVMDLQQYDFNIKHRAGKANANADALSRMFEEDSQTLSCFMISIEKEGQINANESSTPVHEEYDADSEDDYTDRPAQRAIDLLNRCDNLIYDMQSYIEERSENNSPINIVSGIRYDFDNPNGPHPEDCICKVCQPPPARSPSPYSCCNEIICQCNEDNYSIDTEEYNNSWERQIYGDAFSDYSEENQINIEEHIAWTMCGMNRQALENMYLENIKIKQVIAGQQINHGGSRCTMECDTENHHVKN
ncbi:retroviral-like aspartic protease 1 [Rhizophagus irregularis DAOM 181602=DAOM 197198]|nr:retroviral-like aspartic protease 1 [Rhizophagus irregularis DAOM 181602=DAOM 197198]